MRERSAELAAVLGALAVARSLPDILHIVTVAARALSAAHQAATSVVVGGKWERALHAVSLSEKYAAWREYDERPDGSGIYRVVCQLNRPIRLSQAEVEGHSAWRGFGKAAQRHPPMRGWLAVPLINRSGQNCGVIQVSDKHEGEFTEEDETSLVQLAR